MWLSARWLAAEYMARNRRISIRDISWLLVSSSETDVSRNVKMVMGGERVQDPGEEGEGERGRRT